MNIVLQLQNFVIIGHIYTDDLIEEKITKIFKAADKEEEELTSSSATRKREKRISISIYYHREWATR